MVHVYVVTRQKAKIFFTLYCFVVEPTSVLQIDFNLERNFFNEIVRVASSTKACELTEQFAPKVSQVFITFHDIFSGIWQEISQGPKSTFQIQKCAVTGLSFFRVRNYIWDLASDVQIEFVLTCIHCHSPNYQPPTPDQDFLSGILDTSGRYLYILKTDDSTPESMSPRRMTGFVLQASRAFYSPGSHQRCWRSR